MYFDMLSDSVIITLTFSSIIFMLVWFRDGTKFGVIDSLSRFIFLSFASRVLINLSSIAPFLVPAWIILNYQFLRASIDFWSEGVFSALFVLYLFFLLLSLSVFSDQQIYLFLPSFLIYHFRIFCRHSEHFLELLFLKNPRSLHFVLNPSQIILPLPQHAIHSSINRFHFRCHLLRLFRYSRLILQLSCLLSIPEQLLAFQSLIINCLGII